jgi:hypothetical protein
VRYPYPGRSRVAQSAERPAVNRQVIGSSPIAGASQVYDLDLRFLFIRDCLRDSLDRRRLCWLVLIMESAGSPSGRYSRRMSESKRIAGRWRITGMDNWDQEAVDLVQPGFIEFDEDDLGGLGFIAVTGELDCRDADRDGRPGVEFSWQRSDEGDDVSGRGWAALGRDRMPTYIEGPHDDTWRIMHTLRQNVGDGNFHYLVGLRS